MLNPQCSHKSRFPKEPFKWGIQKRNVVVNILKIMTIMELKDRASVQVHISMMQGLINRMASNSANSKLWCVTLLAAILALFFDNKVQHIEFCYLIVGLFYFLDCFYLGLERQLVNAQNDFVRKLNEGNEQQVAKQIFHPYTVGMSNSSDAEFWFIQKILHFAGQLWNTLKATVSFSTTPFYGAIFCTIYYIQGNLSA